MCLQLDKSAKLGKMIGVSKTILALLGMGLIASALAFLPWSLLLPGLIASGGMLVLLHRPWLSWLGLAASLPVLSAIKFSGASLTEVALAAAGLLWFVDGVRRRTLSLRPSFALWGPLLYGVALYLATFQASDLGEAATEVVKWLEFAAVILLVRSMVPPQHNRWLVLALLVGGVGQALLGLYQFIFRIGPDWFIILGRFMRASGSFQQPNPYGGYLGLTLPVAISLALWAWAAVASGLLDDWRSRPLAFSATRNSQGCDSEMQVVPHSAFRTPHLQHLLWALFYTSAAGLIAAGLFASWSRGAWVGASVAGAVVLLVRSQRMALLGGVGVLGLLLAVLLGAFRPDMVPPSIAQRVQDLPAYFGFTDVLNQPVTDENFAVIERLAHWVAAWRMWERSPWLGVGPGNFAVVYPLVQLPRWDNPLGHAHNIYLNVLAESGVVGLLAFLLFWGGSAGWIIRQIRRTDPPQGDWNKALTIGVLGVLVHLAVHNIFDNLFVQGIYLHIALWVGMLDPIKMRS